LINLSNNGYRKITVYSNEVINTNIAFKTRNAKLYTLLIAGKNFSDTARAFTFGLGLGHHFKNGAQGWLGWNFGVMVSL
jgi:hypothetical protein